MPSPYKTNCFDYNKIGCKSRRDCIDKCHIEYTMKHCNSLPPNTILDKKDDKNNISYECYQPNACDKYNSPDCIDEYYTIKPLQETNLRNYHSTSNMVNFDQYITQYTRYNNFNLTKNNIESISYVDIQCYTPDTIYSHSPQQYPVEFICFIGGVISMWTGFSIISIYAYGKHVFNRKQNEKEHKEPVNVHIHINKKFVFINNKINDKISSLKKIKKILKEKNSINKASISQNFN